jgi:hypothetical protein
LDIVAFEQSIPCFSDLGHDIAYRIALRKAAYTDQLSRVRAGKVAGDLVFSPIRCRDYFGGKCDNRVASGREHKNRHRQAIALHDRIQGQHCGDRWWHSSSNEISSEQKVGQLNNPL